MPGRNCHSGSFSAHHWRTCRTEPSDSHHSWPRRDGIQSAVAVETRSPLTGAFTDNGWPSFGIAISATDGNIRSLEARFSQADRPVLGRIDGDRLVLDLRTVFPRQDRQLVEVIVGSAVTDEASAAPSPAEPATE